MERALALAALVVGQVLAGTTLTRALASADERSASHRPLVHELAYGTLRFLGQIRAILRALAHRPLSDPGVEALLWVALYQLVHTRAPAHAVVDCAVRATSRLRRPAAKGLVNAVLRNFLRDSKALLAQVEREPEARFSYPGWWIELIRAQYTDRYAEILAAGNVRPPLCLRINARRTTPHGFMDALAARGLTASLAGGAGVIVDPPRAVPSLPGYAEGAFSVQDAAAQLAAPLLGAQDGMRVLDACAAPGGKTTHLAELAELDLLAIDFDAERLMRVRENLSRLGLCADVALGDAAQPDAWWDGRFFERILADVPCTASGVVRRHPDGKWLRRESDVASFVEQQRRILDALWPLLAHGGRLLYSTCSVFAAENSEQIDAFIARNANATRVQLKLPDSAVIDGQLLPVAGDAEHNHDGFFYALLEKS